MSYGGYDSDTAAAAAATGGRQRRRKEICRSFTCISPWFIFWRSSNGAKPRVSRNRFFERKSGMVKGRSRNHEASSSSVEAVSGYSAESGKEVSFDVGVEFGVIYLVRDELNKMVELRRRIELLLQDFQNLDKKPIIMPSRKPDSDQFISSVEVTHPGNGFGSRRYRREKSMRMDQLEAELEAEFDNLQLNMDSEFLLNCSYQQFPEDNVEEYGEPELSFNACFEEATGSNDEFYGVSPIELERKLHELLEARQQERINELESALDYAMQQLEEKERELCWWSDAAHLVSQRLSAIPGFLREVKQEAIHSRGPKCEVWEMGKSLVKNSASDHT